MEKTETLTEERNKTYLTFRKKTLFQNCPYFQTIISNLTTTTLKPSSNFSLNHKTHFPYCKISFHKSQFPWLEKTIERLDHLGSETTPYVSIYLENTSIYEAIIGSTFEIPRYRDSVFSIVEKWCSETNTFVFSWGEVTITLEDVLVLGGYPVTGDSVLSKISSNELLEIKRKLEIVYSELNNRKARKVSHYQWMDTWMKTGGEFEHEAFLTFWLSRYVMPAKAGGVINKSVFQIAILLARGARIALAPAVLASIYKDLKLLKEMIVSLRELGGEDDGSVSKLSLSSPLQLLQVWVWERFTTLSPKPNPVTDGQPRLQRWHKVEIWKNDDLGLDFDKAVESFRWRPYSIGLNNSSFYAKLYVEKGSWVSVASEVSIDLECYARIVRNSKLVGLCCVEQYLPHRVSMQFGFDQEIPCDLPVTQKIAWSWNDYNRPIGNVKLYIPSRLFESYVTTRYLKWWNDDNCLRKKTDAELTTNLCESSSKSKISMSVPPGFSPKGKRVGDCSDKRSRGTLYRPEIVIESSESDGSPDSSSKICSAGDNAVIQQIKSPRKQVITEGGNQSKPEIGSTVIRPISIHKNETQTTFNATPESACMDILDRIAGLQRIVDMVKAEKQGQV